MDNMQIYNAGRSVPTGAVKKITGGAYGAAGLSDINPQWRLEKMTEIFGPCGIGWTWTPEDYHIENGYCFAHVTVRYRVHPERGFSEPIHGYGGTLLGKKDDSDVLKSTFTDAISNALRYLGIGADVWYKAGRDASGNQFDSKYSAPPVKLDAAQPDTATPEQVAAINAMFPPIRISAMLKHYKVTDVAQLTKAQADMAIRTRQREIEKEKEGANG